MIRSNFAITRLILLPYGALLVLYLLIVGGGGAWLYLQVRAAETRLLIDDIKRVIQPLAEKLGLSDAVALMENGEPWLMTHVQGLFADLPSLRNVSVRDQNRGFEMNKDTNGIISSRAVSSLPADARRASTDSPATQRLHAKPDALFLIRFDLTPETAPLARLDFAFDRSMMLARINSGLAVIEQAILWFGLAGGVSILLALIVTVVAMNTTRKVERHFQEIYQRASIAEMAAQLVHDLRNPLMALRTNVKALLITPEQTHEIVDELDRDIVTLNDKLSAFLNLTRPHDDIFAPIEISELIDDAVRLAEPTLAKHRLSVDKDIPPDLPKPSLRKDSMRDALLNVIINAGQSGQTEGAITIKARARNGVLDIVVEDQGRGIPKEHLPHLFDAFYTTRADGNGLGLAIVQRVVAAHQGKVCAENRPQDGAKIVLTLPLQPKETPHWWKKLKKNSPA